MAKIEEENKYTFDDIDDFEFEGYDHYDRKNILRKRRIKRFLIVLGTGAVIVFGAKKLNFKLPNIPKMISTLNKDEKETEPTEKEIELYDEFGEPVPYSEETEYDPDYDYTDDVSYETLEDTNAKLVRHNIEDRVAAIILGYSLYDNSISIDNEELTKVIDFMNGDYEVSNKAEAEIMYKKVIEYYLSILNSNKYIDLVNNTSYRGSAYAINFADLTITDKDIEVYPIIEKLDELHRIILSTGNKKERENAIIEFSKIITRMCYGGYELNGKYYYFSLFAKKENIAAASLLEQYVLEIMPLLANMDNISTEKLNFYEKTFNDEEGFMGLWKDNLIDANTDGEYTYTLH